MDNENIHLHKNVPAPKDFRQYNNVEKTCRNC